MEFESLKDEVKEIGAIAASVPEEFRARCFELLLAHLLAVRSGAGSAEAPPHRVPSSSTPFPVSLPAAALGYTSAPPLSALIRAFLSKNRLSVEEFHCVVGYLGGKVIFLRGPAQGRTAKSQIDWALLLALRRAIQTGNFGVDGEEVRAVCEEKGAYDRKNFYTNFRRMAEYFRSPPEPGGKVQPLSAKGIAALGNLVRELARAD